jgi:hypothetical protein
MRFKSKWQSKDRRILADGPDEKLCRAQCFRMSDHPEQLNLEASHIAVYTGQSE